MSWVRRWAGLGQPWRRELEINPRRQRALRRRAAVRADVLRGTYPYKGLRLCRADVEWLVSASQGPEPGRIDLRGAILEGADLSELPLSHLVAGTSGPDWRLIDQEVPDAARRDVLFRAAATDFRNCKLVGTDLTGASLTYADFRGAKLSDCHLEGADLFRADFGGEVPANLHGATLDRDTRLNEAVLASPAGIAPRLFDVRWNGASLSGVAWSSIKKVADEKRAYHRERRRPDDSWRIHSARRVIWYSEAAQTYRQLSMALREQGINDQARRFAYRAEVAQFWSLFHSLTDPRRWPSFAFSLLLGAISGWGYRLYQSAILYAATILTFAALYHATADPAHPYSWREATILSVVAFHGRAFYADSAYEGLRTTFASVGAVEAFVGLFIEAIVIATFTRRLFSD